MYEVKTFYTDCCNCIHTYVEYYGAWDGSNCRVLRETDEEVECGCDHLTHFAILLVSDTQHRSMMSITA